MRLLPKLLSRLFRAVSTDPDAFVAMRLGHSDGGEWSVAEGWIWLQPLTEPRQPPTALDLRQHTLRSLAAAISAMGWNVDDLHPEERDRGAICLIEESVSTVSRPTGSLLAYDNPVYALLDANAIELATAGETAAVVGQQLAVPDADEIWLEELGDQYGVPRLPGEQTEDYRSRFIAELIKPKTNNLAMETIIERATGQPTQVIDVTIYGPEVPIYDGSIIHDGTYQHDSGAKAFYGVFDVVTGFALEGSSDLATHVAIITAQAKRLKASGTSLRTVRITGGQLSDTASGPLAEPSGVADLGLSISTAFAESAPGDDTSLGLVLSSDFQDAGGAADEAGDIALAYAHVLNGAWRLDGSRPLSSGVVLNQPL